MNITKGIHNQLDIIIENLKPLKDMQQDMKVIKDTCHRIEEKLDANLVRLRKAKKSSY